MKKLLSLLSIFSLFFVNTMSLINCENITNNKPHFQPISLENELIEDNKLATKEKIKIIDTQLHRHIYF